MKPTSKDYLWRVSTDSRLLGKHTACASCSAGRGRFGSSQGRGYQPTDDSRQPPYGRGQLYQPPQHGPRHAGGSGGRGHTHQPRHVPQHQQQSWNAPQQHISEHQPGSNVGQGRGLSRGRHTARGRGRGYC